MPSAGRKLTKDPYWFQNNGISFYGFVGSDTVLGSVAWKRYADGIVWVGCLREDFGYYREFDNETEAKAYVEAIVALTYN